MNSPFDIQDASESQPFNDWEHAPTPGNFSLCTATPSVLGPASPMHAPYSDTLELLQLSDWEEGRAYDDDPPAYIHYSIEWKVTVNNRMVAKDTEPDLVLTPSAYWDKVLKEKLDKRVQAKTRRSRRVRSDDTAIEVSVNDRSQRNLNKWFEKTNIQWSAIERQLLKWRNLFRIGKRLTVSISFNYIDDGHNTEVSKRVDKRGPASTTQQMLSDRDAEIEAENSSGGGTAWDKVYRLMRCPGPPCNLGQWCWQDPVGKKHYKLTQTLLRSLVKYVQDEHGVLETHDDVPDRIRQHIYAEEQRPRRLPAKDSSLPVANGTPININVLPTQPSHSSTLAIPSAAPTMLSPSNTESKSCLRIPGPRDIAVKRYSIWQESNVADEILKADFRNARDIALTNGLDLEQVYEDQNPEFFIEHGVKIGIARRFVRDIGDWVKICENDANN